MILGPTEKVLYYSLDKELWIKQLKTWAYEKKLNTHDLEKWMQENQIHRQLADEEGYHFKFHRIVGKPYVVYYQWNIELLNSSILGIVWPRKVSNYAKNVMRDIFAILPRYDLVTISWGAPGVDTMCHELSLENNIPTIVVLWAWLGYYLQRQQRHLIKKVVDAWWLVISEFKLKQEPTNYTFPQRNRIVAGLSDTVFVPAAGKKSGSLITVDFALQMHTPVASVPASIYDDTSAWSNAYIAEGKIKAIIDFEYFLDRHFILKNLSEQQKSPPSDLSKEHQAIIDLLREHGEQSLEQLSIWLQVPLSALMAEMTILEMQWLVYEVKPGVYGVK